MLSLPKHLYRAVRCLSNDASELVRKALLDVLYFIFIRE